MNKKKSDHFHVILVTFKEYNDGLEFFLDEFYLKKVNDKWRRFSKEDKAYLAFNLSEKQFKKYSDEDIDFNIIVKDKNIDDSFFPISFSPISCELTNLTYVLYDKILFDYLSILKKNFDEKNKKLLNLLSKEKNHKLLLKKLNKKESVKKETSKTDEIIVKKSDWAFKEDKWNFYKTNHEKCNILLLREDWNYCPRCGVKITWVLK